MALSPFICTCRAPLTIMTVSLGVCQWNGATQPGAKRARITDASFVGSPFSTAIVKHFGAVGIAENLACAAGAEIGWSWAATRLIAHEAQTAAKASRRTRDFSFIIFLPF